MTDRIELTIQGQELRLKIAKEQQLDEARFLTGRAAEVWGTLQEGHRVSNGDLVAIENDARQLLQLQANIKQIMEEIDRLDRLRPEGQRIADRKLAL